MKVGDKVVVINGIRHGKHGEVVDVLPDGNLRCRFKGTWYILNELQEAYSTITLKPHDVELEEREDLWMTYLT